MKRVSFIRQLLGLSQSRASQRKVKSMSKGSMTEQLERRQVLTGNVSATVSAGSLILVGDEAGNSVEVARSGSNLVVRGLDNTTINGQSGEFLVRGGTNSIERSLFAYLNGGNDSLSLGDGVTVQRDAFVYLGEGNDTFAMQGSNAQRGMLVDMGNGNDNISLLHAFIHRDATFIGLLGNKTVSLSDSYLGNHFTLVTISGNDAVLIDNTHIDDVAYAYTGLGNDDVLIGDSSFQEAAIIDTSSGDDLVQIQNGSTFRDPAVVVLGDGSDTLAADGNNQFQDSTVIITVGGNDIVDTSGTNTFSETPILVGSAQATADDAAIDARVNAPQTGPIARATNLQTAIESLITLPELTVTSSANTIAENATTTLTGTVTRPTASFGDVLIILTSSDETEAKVPAEVTIPAGQTSVTFTITPANDTDVDNKQTVTVTATAVGYKAGTTEISVTDDEVPALTLSFDLPTLNEVAPGNTVTGTVSRPSTHTSGALSVTIANSDDTQASAPTTVEIADGQTSATFTLTADDDTVADGSKSVAITVSATGFTPDTENVTVTDNESAATLTLILDPTSVTENAGASASTGTVTRNNNTDAELVVTIVSDDTTAATVPATVTIPAGKASATFVIAAVDDTLADGTQTAKITVSATNFASDTESLSVTDNDGAAALTLTLNPTSVSEDAGASASTGTVTRNTATSEALIVNLASSLTSAATVPATVTIPANQTSVTFAIAVIDDELVNDTRTVTITANATGLTSDSETLSVTNEDVLDPSTSLSLTLAANAIGEAPGSRITAATVSRPNSDVTNDLIVTVVSSDTTEVTVPATVTIPAGQTSKTFDVTAIDDAFADGTKSAVLTVSATGLENATAQISVTDDEGAAALTVNITPGRVSESGGTTAAVGSVVRNTEPTEDLVVTFSSSLPSGIGAIANVTIPAGQSAASFNVSVLNNTDVDGEQEVTIFADAAGHAAGTGTFALIDDDAPDLTLTIDETEVSEAGTNPVATATVSRPAGNTSMPLVVSLSSTSSKLPTTPTVVIPSGETSVTFVLNAVNNSIADGAETVTLEASADGFNNDSASLEITDDDGPATLTVAIVDTSVSESLLTSVIGTVTRNTDPTAPLTVNLTSSNIGEISVVSSVVIPAGQASATFNMTVVNDDFSDGTQSVTITPSLNGFVGVGDSIDVTDDDGSAALTLELTLNAIIESDSANALTGRVTRNTDPTVPLEVSVTTSLPGTIAVPTTVTIPANSEFVTFSIGIVNNEVFTGHQTATVTVTAGALTASQPLTVNEDDTPSLSVQLNSSALAENAGTQAAFGTVFRPAGSEANDVTVTLTSNDESEVTVDTTVVIPAGKLSATFGIVAIDDTVIDGDQTVTITAAATFFTSASAQVSVTDNDDLISLVAPTTGVATVEGDLITRTASFTVTGKTAANAAVTLDSDADGEFDDGSATADDSGDFSLTTTLVNNDTNLGRNVLSFRTTSDLGTQTENLPVHFAVGSVIEFESSQGSFAVEMFDADAPLTVANFKNYLTRYTDSIIHRSPANFVIQGGGFTVENHENGVGHVHNIVVDAPVMNEFDLADNSNVRGTLAMALPGGVNGINEGTSQWFINVRDNSGIDGGKYTVFGRVIGNGMDVVDQINDLPTVNLITQTDNGALGETPTVGNLAFEAIDGTVSVQSGSTVVTGVGTSFLSDFVATSNGVNGSTILIDGESYIVAFITSDTSLRLNRNATSTQTNTTAGRHAVPSAANYVVFSNIGELLNGGT